ncbi:hypothetical protein F0Q45_25935, partial [Mycobacterium simiae]
VFSGRLSTSTHGWLAGHQINDTVVFPATGFIDVILSAGEVAGCPVIDELTLHTPLRLARHSPTDIQITVYPKEDNQRRRFTVHARTDHDSPTAWTMHASGALTTDQHLARPPLAALPSVQAISQDSFYEHLATHGYQYGPPFQGVHGIGADPTYPDTIYAEVVLPTDTEITGYGIHPALLDAALHPLAAKLLDTADDTDAPTPRLPFTFSGIRLHANAPTRLHITLSATGPDTFRLHATDPTGASVIAINTLTLRPLPKSLTSVPAATIGDSLFHLDWLALPEDTFPAATVSPKWAAVTNQPERLPASLHSNPIHSDLGQPHVAHTDLAIWFLPVPDPTTKSPTPHNEDPLQRVHALLRHTLTGLQTWLTRPDTADTHLVIITGHGTTTSTYDPAPDLAHAAAYALIHTTQNEHPDRITVIDTDHTPTTGQTLTNVLAALATPTRRSAVEAQLAIRHGKTHTPRLTPTPLAVTPPQPATVLD